MSNTFKRIAPILGAGAAAAALTLAPAAVAEPQAGCEVTEAATTCESPGSANVTVAAP